MYEAVEMQQCLVFPSPFVYLGKRAQHIRKGCHGRGNRTSCRSTLEKSQLALKISLAKSSGSLDLGWLGLDHIPEEIFQIQDLEELVLAGNQLQSLPDQIGQFRSLRKLQVAGNLLTSLPPVISSFQHLQEVWFHGNLLDHLPEDVGMLTSLEKLSLSGNRLESLPQSISQLVNLKELSLSGNTLQELSPSLGELGKLQSLSINGNRLTKIAPELGRCKALRNLNLQTNQIPTIPESFTNLQMLEELNLSDNKLSSLPSGWHLLQRCHEIWLYGNQLKQLPAEIWGLPSLECLWLEGNPLDNEDLNEALKGLQKPRSKLREIGLDTNQIKSTSCFPSEVRTKIRLGKVPPAGPGYFKVQPSEKSQDSGLLSRPADNAEGDLQIRADLLVVTFASAPGVPNWGGVLSKLAAQAGPEERNFDIFFVCDGGRNWYSGGDQGLATWREQIEAVTKLYKKVLMLGDSMGGTGALLFSDLATSVEVFTPQVRLIEASMRPGHSKAWLDNIEQNILTSVASSSAVIHCHTGTWDHDLIQAKLLPEDKCELIVHMFDSHRLAISLNRNRQLLPIIRTAILKELGQYTPPRLVNLV